MSDTKFEAGDTVSWMGVEGVVICSKHSGDYPIECYFKYGIGLEYTNFFTSKGRFFYWHTEPSLKLVRKAKKKITVECWVNVYKDNVTKLFNNKEEADNDSYRVAHMYGYQVTTVHLSKEIEI